MPERLAARAFALAVDPEVSLDAAGEVLSEMARGNAAALESARRRVEARLYERPARLAESAALGLRAAVLIAHRHEPEKPVEQAGTPLSVAGSSARSTCDAEGGAAGVGERHGQRATPSVARLDVASSTKPGERRVMGGARIRSDGA
ncbi:MAG: hypothetical protein ACRD03_13195 [Acidimicrobiales bacterium]